MSPNIVGKGTKARIRNNRNKTYLNTLLGHAGARFRDFTAQTNMSTYFECGCRALTMGARCSPPLSSQSWDVKCGDFSGSASRPLPPPLSLSLSLFFLFFARRIFGFLRRIVQARRLGAVCASVNVRLFIANTLATRREKVTRPTPPPPASLSNQCPRVGARDARCRLCPLFIIKAERGGERLPLRVQIIYIFTWNLIAHSDANMQPRRGKDQPPCY